MENYIPPEPTTTPSKREYSSAERLLLPLALLIGILFDRLFFARVLYEKTEDIFTSWGIFWICYLVIFTAFFWKRLVSNKVLWFITVCSAALCAWEIIFKGNDEYSAVTFLVIPTVLMAHAALFSGEYALKDVGRITIEWFSGWFIKPFSGLGIFSGTIGTFVSGGKRPIMKKILLGVVITLPLLCIIVPLLGGADSVFNYYLRRALADWNPFLFAVHVMAALLVSALFYSFLWNIGFDKKGKAAVKASLTIDTIVCGIVLGTVTLIYLLFCGVQFTYLFAGAGLPGGMSYSEYAREGFAQTVTVCAINLGLFGVFLRFGARGKTVKILLSGLLTLTGVMLVSGAVRLWLYINAYGLTWLRLISGWFIIYLAVVIILCAARMLREKLPLIALCALLLLGWYVALGYSNPDKLIMEYNQTYGYDAIQTE